MRCKFCGLETKSAVCEYCGYDNVHGDNYDTSTVTSANYKGPKLNTNNYGSESTAEHAAHAPYEEPEWGSSATAQNAENYHQTSFEEFDSTFPDPGMEDYRNSIPYNNVSASGERGKSSFNWKKFNVGIFILLLFIQAPLAFLYLILTTMILKDNE
ncbi:MAG: hypothetical protein IJV50_10525 [Lachnospiraceae bacterium]|nr:hypothetical protein [Lachnospiraceae bacterium]